MNKHQTNEFASSSPNIINIVSSLKKFSQVAQHPESIASISEADLTNLSKSIDAFEAIKESQNIVFDTVSGKFISRAEAKPLRKDFKKWADNIFRSGVIKKLDPLYVNAELVGKLLKRVSDDDFIEISLGMRNDKICVFVAAVTKEGKRVDDPTKDTGGNEDVLDDMRPCPQPPCPTGLEE